MTVPSPLLRAPHRPFVWFILVGLVTALLGGWVVGDFDQPLSTGHDADQFEYAGYYLFQHLSWLPLPHLNLFNDDVFYPYGTWQVFLDWGLERDYWYAGCYALFGRAGPYLQPYYVYTLVVASAGTFALLQGRYGPARALAAGFVVSVFNVYALFKYPEHLNIAVCHWTTLCMVATYRLLIDWLAGRPLPLPFVLLWGWLHVQVLSQELGYIAGFALTFTTVCAPVFIGQALVRYPAWRHWPARFGAYWRSEYGRRPRQTAGLLALIAFSTFLYVPLVIQISVTALRFDFAGMPALPAWSHPLRLLVPLLSSSWPHLNRFGDYFESYGQGSPGLYLVLLAAAGAWQTRRQTGRWLPIVAMLGLCLLYHPVLLPLLKAFPWFSFNRHGGRASVVYPTLLCLLALPVRRPATPAGWLLAGGLALLAGAELSHAYQFRLTARPARLSDRFGPYMARVRQQPGEAVLDWPFCVVGGDGTGQAEGLCPNYDRLSSTFTYRRFHNKKVIGQYFGRLHPGQISPFLREGWPRLLTPDRSFTPADWQFLDQFLREHHFAGINLYTDVLPAAHVRAFHQHYGPAVAQTRLPGAGRVEFIPLAVAGNQP